VGYPDPREAIDVQNRHLRKTINSVVRELIVLPAVSAGVAF
jgi:hypothetical protein